MTQELVLLRGLPGSGKTHQAVNHFVPRGYVHCEADQYFIGVDGAYRFAPTSIAHAHDDCRRRACAALRAGKSVVVANTFTRSWEVAPYRALAEKHGAKLRIITMRGTFENVHGVPPETMAKMRERFEEIDA